MEYDSSNLKKYGVDAVVMCCKNGAVNKKTKSAKSYFQAQARKALKCCFWLKIFSSSGLSLSKVLLFVLS